MHKVTLTEPPVPFSGKLSPLPGDFQFDDASFQFDDASLPDIDYFINTLSVIKGKGIRPDLIGSIITHYASKWLPDLSTDETQITVLSPETVASSWMKKKFFIETLIGILPIEKDSIPCNFLLRLLRLSNMVGVEFDYCKELERRVSLQLDQASLKEILIPAFGHDCDTLLDVELVVRLVRRFVGSDEVARTGVALLKVARLVDSYLAEAAIDSHLTVVEFVGLASAIPGHARSMDDGLYRAIDMYLKAHPSLPKPDRKKLFNLLDSRKLSSEASLHAAQNERLPVRAVIQVLLSEQNKSNKIIDWSGSLSVGTRSPGLGFEGPTRCHSKREISIQQMEIKRLKEDVLRLQSQCMKMEKQIEEITERTKKKGYFFGWKNIPVFRGNKKKIVGEVEVIKTPVEVKPRLVRGRTSTRWRKSVS